MSTHMPGQRRIKTAMTKKVQMRRMRKTRVSENVKDNEYVPGAFVQGVFFHWASPKNHKF